MVAYNFKSAFHQPIIAGLKRQTVRHAGGKRHARPGELVQIYAGLRTKEARKLIADPICTAADNIMIPVSPIFENGIGRIEINGIPLSDDEMEAFAVADGVPALHGVAALAVFGRFWAMTHGVGNFEGVVIHWTPM